MILTFLLFFSCLECGLRGFTLLESYLEEGAVYVSCNCPNSTCNTDFPVDGMLKIFFKFFFFLCSEAFQKKE